MCCHLTLLSLICLSCSIHGSKHWVCKRFSKSKELVWSVSWSTDNQKIYYFFLNTFALLTTIKFSDTEQLLCFGYQIESSCLVCTLWCVADLDYFRRMVRTGKGSLKDLDLQRLLQRLPASNPSSSASCNFIAVLHSPWFFFFRSRKPAFI